MLAKMEMQIECNEELNYQMSSLFQGALMELLDAEYASKLHESQRHPYAQHLEVREKLWYWVVSALNEEAVKEILIDSLMEIQEIFLKKKGWKVIIRSKNYQELKHENLLRDFYEKESSRYISIHFITPTAFKSHGKYVFYPEPRLLFQSLMGKYDAAARDEEMIDMETLEQLSENASIYRYDLKSTVFHLEGVKISAFIGKLTLRMDGTQTMTNFANLLFRFGTYSGIGIKSSIGMGAYRILEKGGN